LFALLGTSYGAGDGTTTFNVPDYRGRTLVGHDASQPEFDVLGETGGAKTHTLTTAQMPSHTHVQNAHNHTQNAHGHNVNDPSHAHTQAAHFHRIGLDGAADGTLDVFLVQEAGGAYSGWGSNIDHTNGGARAVVTDQRAPVINASFTGVSVVGNTATNQATTATNQNSGLGEAHNNLQPYTVVKWIICAASSSGNFDTEVQTALVTNVSSLQVGHRLVETLYITSSTTFAKAAYPWLRAIRVRAVGAGGAGGGCGAFSRSAGGGGGGGGTAERFITDIASMAASVVFLVGAGGAPGAVNTNGGTGGASTVNLPITLVGQGGAGGVVAPGTTGEIARGGNGGNGNGGDIGYVGQSGGISSSGAAFAFGGTGGSSGFGIGGGASQVSANDNGNAAVGFGGGGSGASNSASSLARSGGAGAPGIVIIELYA
jgi:microcystin-dependent protein